MSIHTFPTKDSHVMESLQGLIQKKMIFGFSTNDPALKGNLDGKSFTIPPLDDVEIPQFLGFHSTVHTGEDVKLFFETVLGGIANIQTQLKLGEIEPCPVDPSNN